MKPLLALAVAVVVGLLVVQGYQSRHDAVWKADKARVLAQASHDKATADSLRKFSDGLQARAKEAERVAERNLRMAIASRQEANSIVDTLSRASNGSDSATIALHAVQMLQVALDTTLAALEATRASQELIRIAYSAQVTRSELYKSSLDSVVALVGRVPSQKRWLPVVTVGYGAVLSGGVVRTGVGAQVGFRIAF